MIRTLAVAGVFSFLTGCTGAEHVEWIQTTASDPWGIKDAIVLADEHPENAVIITLDSRDLRQTMFQ
jgi:hypothetical protein